MIQYRLVTFIAVVTTLFSCSGEGNRGDSLDQKEILYTTIEPIKYMVEEIVGGDKYSVKTLVPKGVSPETYSPTVKQIAALSNSKVYFKTGHLGFESGGMDKIKSINIDMKIVNCSRGVDLIASKEFVHGDHIHKGGIDPHTWLSISSARSIALNIKSAMVQIDSSNSALYRDNYKLFNTKLDSLEALIDKKMESSKGTTFAIFHPALAYFARDYNLKQVAIEADGKSPSAKHIQKVIEIFEEHNIDKILIQKEFNVSSAKVITDETNSTALPIETLSYEWPDMMVGIADAIKK